MVYSQLVVGILHHDLVSLTAFGSHYASWVHVELHSRPGSCRAWSSYWLLTVGYRGLL